ncbi:Signal recognition particle subunit SRP68 [Coccomyxa sp. Obi]|nr:Signal recognition particle subunit SRP68 [Coccomyxa sp. Obi]
MATSEAQAAPEPMAVDEGEELAPAPLLSLSLLQVVKTAQAQHGLRHSDYTRYRQYCTRKLHRLYKAVKLTHGRGKYLQRKLDASTVTEVGHLLIPLVGAERCWSQAMEMRAQLEKEPLSYKRQHMIRRLAKAAQLAGQLSDLASKRCDDGTALETEAYALYMAGNLLFEKQQWEAALAKLARAKSVYQELARLGSPEQQALLHKQLDDLAAPISFCKYKLKKSNDDDADSLTVPDSPSAKVIQSKLESLAAQQGAQQSSSGKGVSAIAWRGNTTVVSAERVRLTLAQALDLSKQVDEAKAANKPLAEMLELYDSLIAAFNEAKGYVRHSISGGRANEASSGVDELKALDVTVTGLQLERTIERGQALVADTRARYESSSQSEPTVQKVVKKKKGKQDKGGPAKAEDVVRLYESLMGHVKELSENAARLGGAAGEILLEECTAKRATFQALRCFYAARSYLASGKPLEALGLFQRTAERAGQAEAAWDDLERPSTEALAELASLKAQCQAWRCAAHAECIGQRILAEQEAQEGIDKLGLDAKPAASARYLVDNLDRWESFAGGEGRPARLCPVPPRLAPVAVRPFMLDSALNYIRAPPLDHRTAKEEAKSTFSRIFTWGAKK